ncbi:MAG: pyrimidine 5'-nucleotidase [Betaproteobacteria bacterium]|nr:pyrimidine 5'-nucleotidase [Betaproteobacteria bacterium]
MWIFDLDNTLHDARVHIFPSMHLQINAWLKRNLGLDEEGANLLRQGYWRRYGTTLHGLMRHHGTDPREFLWQTHQFPDIDRMVVYDNALRHALQRLQGRKLLFSNAPRHYVDAVLRAMRLHRYFDSVYTIESTRFRPKPAYAGFHVLMRAYHLDAHRCAFVDDSLDNLRAAKRLGMSTVWVSPRMLRPSFVDLRVGSMIELPRLAFRYCV